MKLLTIINEPVLPPPDPVTVLLAEIGEIV